MNQVGVLSSVLSLLLGVSTMVACKDVSGDDPRPNKRVVVQPSLDLSAACSAAFPANTKTLRCQGADNASLAKLAKLTSLRSLTLSTTSQTDVSGIAHLTKLRLDSLNLTMHNATEPTLRQIGDLSSLTALEFQATRTTPQGLAHLANLGSLRSLALVDLKVTPAVTAQLARLSSLRTLRLTVHTPLTPSALRHLGKLTSLRSLTFSNAAVTDVSAHLLDNLTNLRVLSVSGGKLTDAGLVHLLNAHPLLEELSGNFLQLTKPDPTVKLHRHHALRRLDLTVTKVTDAWLLRLNDLPALERLTLAFTLVSGPGLVHLAQLGSLRSLSLYRNPLTHNGLDHLGRLKQLKHLGITSSANVTDVQVAILKQALPDCSVHIDVPLQVPSKR